MKGKKIKNAVINNIGCFAAWWILHNCEDGLVVKRKCGAKQIIKVFAEPAYKNIIKPAIHKATEVIKVGDIVTDNGYHGKVCVTCIDYDTFRGYYLSDGVVVSGLRLNDFKKIVSHIDVKVETPKEGRN